MDVLTPNMVASPRFCAILPKPHPHNLGLLTSTELLLIGGCVLISCVAILNGKGRRGDD